MDDNVTDFPAAPDPVSAMMGPKHTGRCVIVEGRAIPGLTMHEEGDAISFVLDNRLSISVPRDTAPQIAWFVASALAIGQGYTHIGAANKDRPFAPQVVGLAHTPAKGDEP